MEFKPLGSKPILGSGTGPLSKPELRFHPKPAQIELGGGFSVKSQISVFQGSEIQQSVFSKSSSLGSAKPNSSLINAPTFSPTGLEFSTELHAAKSAAFMTESGNVDRAGNALGYPAHQILSSHSPQECQQIYDTLCQAQLALGKNPENIAEINQTLQKVGLMIYDGKVINLAKSRNLDITNPANLAKLETLNFKEIEQLKTVAVARKRDLNQITSNFRSNPLQVYSPPVAGIMRRMSGVGNNDFGTQVPTSLRVPMVELTAQVLQLTEKLNTLLKEADGNAIKQDVVEQKIESTQKSILDGQQVLATVQSIYDKVPAGVTRQNINELNQQLDQVNSMSGYQLSLEYTDAGPKLQINGKVVTAAEFKAQLDKVKAVYSTGLQTDIQSLAKHEADLKRILEEGQRIKKEIESTSSDSEIGIHQLGEAQKLTEQSLEQLVEIRNDPTKWSQLNPDEQDLIDKEIAKLRTDLAKADQVKKQAQTAVENGRKAVEKLTQNAIRGTAKLKGNGQFWDALSKMKLDLSKLSKTPKTEQNVEMDSKVKTFAELIKQADELGRQLTLSPVPQGAELKALEEKWQDILNEASTRLIAQARSSQTIQASERQRMEQVSQDIRENLDYHQGKLEQLAEGQQERIEILLASLQGLASSLQ